MRRAIIPLAVLLLLAAAFGTFAAPTFPTAATGNASSLQGKRISSTVPADGQFLKYVSATGQWTPSTAGGAALSNPVTPGQGGTGLTTLTPHALYVGNGASTPNAVAAGATGTLLAGATGTDPAFTGTPSVTTLTGNTSLVTPLLDAASAGPLNIGTTTATSVGLKQNTSLPTGKTLVVGANTLIGAITDKLNGLMLAVTGQQVGDLYVADSTTTMARLPKGNTGQVLGYSSTTVAALPVYAVQGEIDSGTTGAGNVDLTVFAVPAGTIDNTNSFQLTVIVRLAQALAGSGSITFTCGTSAGGTQYIASASVTSSTGVGTEYGLTTGTVGSACTSGNMYACLANGSSSVICRSALSGTVTTQAKFIITVTGSHL